MFFISSKKELPHNILNYYIFESTKSLIKQSKCNEKRLQKDGWGIACFNSELKIYKSPGKIYEEQETVKKMINSYKTNSFIIHIRKASNPRKLEFKKLISVNNTQPYSYQNIVFTHNGTLNIVDEIYQNLGKYKKFVKGLNDSEVLFWHIIKNIEAYGDISSAIKAARREIHTVWISVKKDYRHFDEPYTGLNVFISDTKKFYALCDFKLKKEIYSLMTPHWEYGNYALRKEKDYFIISSEPLDDKKWIKIKYNSMVEFDISTYQLKISDAGEPL